MQRSAAIGQPAIGSHSMVSAPIPLTSQSEPSNSILPANYNMFAATQPTTNTVVQIPVQPSMFVGCATIYVPWHNNKPFFVMNINGRIKKCAGCQREFADPFDPVFVGIVIQHIKRDYYNDKNGFQRIGSEQARYYHPNKQCIMVCHQHFSSRMLQLHPGVSVDELQARHFRQHLGIENIKLCRTENYLIMCFTNKGVNGFHTKLSVLMIVHLERSP